MLVNTQLFTFKSWRGNSNIIWDQSELFISMFLFLQIQAAQKLVEACILTAKTPNASTPAGPSHVIQAITKKGFLKVINAWHFRCGSCTGNKWDILLWFLQWQQIAYFAVVLLSPDLKIY